MVSRPVYAGKWQLAVFLLAAGTMPDPAHGNPKRELYLVQAENNDSYIAAIDKDEQKGAAAGGSGNKMLLGGKVPPVGSAKPTLTGSKPPSGGGKVPSDGGRVPSDGGKVPFDGGKVPYDGGKSAFSSQIVSKGGRPLTPGSGSGTEIGPGKQADTKGSGGKLDSQLASGMKNVTALPIPVTMPSGPKPTTAAAADSTPSTADTTKGGAQSTTSKGTTSKANAVTSATSKPATAGTTSKPVTEGQTTKQVEKTTAKGVTTAGGPTTPPITANPKLPQDYMDEEAKKEAGEAHEEEEEKEPDSKGKDYANTGNKADDIEITMADAGSTLLAPDPHKVGKDYGLPDSADGTLAEGSATEENGSTSEGSENPEGVAVSDDTVIPSVEEAGATEGKAESGADYSDDNDKNAASTKRSDRAGNDKPKNDPKAQGKQSCRDKNERLKDDGKSASEVKGKKDITTPGPHVIQTLHNMMTALPGSRRRRL